LFNLMEDAATAEISRAQLWQWVHHSAHLKDGRRIDVALCDTMIAEELGKAKQGGDAARIATYEQAAGLMREMIRAPRFVEFLTLKAYQRLLEEESAQLI
jgi:malate synthase